VSDIATWGDYEVHFDGVLGRGGMGTVYRAWQRSVGRWVAVKVLDASRAADPEIEQGFLQKFQV
jgi:serine/threonine protein kinase